MYEYIILATTEVRPWQIMVGVIILLVLLLPSHVAVRRGRRRRIKYVSSIVRYVGTPKGWTIELRGVAWVQQALLQVISGLWVRVNGVMQASLWALLRAWIARW